jgi:hypothetical protein
MLYFFQIHAVLFGKRAHPFLKEDVPFCYASLKLLPELLAGEVSSYVREAVSARSNFIYIKIRKRVTNDKKNIYICRHEMVLYNIDPQGTW